MIKVIDCEILEAIDNIEHEQFSTLTDVNFAISDFYDKQCTLMEYCTDDQSGSSVGYFMEAASENKPVLDTIWKTIKRIFTMLIMHIRMMIDKIKLFFNKNDGKHSQYVSCDSIVLRILSNSRANVPDDLSSWRIPKIDSKYAVDRGKYSTDKEIEKYEKKHKRKKGSDTRVYSESATDSRYVTINIPVGKGSTMYPKTVKVPKSDIITEINKDDKTITFHIKGKGKLQKIKSVDDNNTNSTSSIEGVKKSWTHSAHISLYLISEPEKLDKLIALTDLATEILFSEKKSHIHIFNKKCKSIIETLNYGAKHKKLSSVKVSMKDLSNFQKKINDLNYKLDKFANINCDVSSLSKETINNFNRLSKALLDIQVSMNALTSSLESSIIVNQQFVGSIKNLALLDQFVATCIDEGMPPKYIAYNTWLVANECIRGKGDEYKPVWGQTRFIFFPPGDKFVLKIAMSGLGITSNRAEVRTSEMFEKMGRIDLIAPIVKTWDRDTIVAMERIHSTGNVSLIECGVYTNNVNSVISEYEKEHNVKLNIKISDQHMDNVKFDSKNKCYRSIDYGIASRSS